MAKDSTISADGTAQAKVGFFGKILLFIRQVVSELKKVVYPTREELTTYLGVVLVFIVAMIVFTGLVDLGISRLVVLVFAGS